MVPKNHAVLSIFKCAKTRLPFDFSRKVAHWLKGGEWELLYYYLLLTAINKALITASHNGMSPPIAALLPALVAVRVRLSITPTQHHGRGK